MISRKSILAVLMLGMASSLSAQDWAKARLENSPRHLEYITVKQGDREVRCFIAFPEVKEKATAVLVIHEIFGLSDWVRSVADQLAEAGYIAIAPDLLSGMGPKGGGTDELESGDGVRKVIRSLPPDQITADLTATAEYVTTLPAANGKLAVAGFCWGGGQTFRFATNSNKIGAALVFYGSAPEGAEEISRIACPVYGFYGENDARINAGLDATKQLMLKAGKQFDPVVYSEAGHGFMRAGEGPEPRKPDQSGREAGWKRVREILGKL